jgi:hypothetical protein
MLDGLATHFRVGRRAPILPPHILLTPIDTAFSGVVACHDSPQKDDAAQIIAYIGDFRLIFVLVLLVFPLGLFDAFRKAK